MAVPCCEKWIQSTRTCFCTQNLLLNKYCLHYYIDKDMSIFQITLSTRSVPKMIYLPRISESNLKTKALLAPCFRCFIHLCFDLCQVYHIPMCVCLSVCRHVIVLFHSNTCTIYITSTTCAPEKKIKVRNLAYLYNLILLKILMKVNAL